MEHKYLRVGTPLLVIAKEQFLLTGDAATDIRAVIIKVGTVLCVNYQSHFISDDIIEPIPPNSQLQQPRIELLATLAVCGNHEDAVSNWLNKTVKIPLNKVVVLEAAKDRVSANWFVAPVASFSDVANAVAAHPLYCAKANWWDTVLPPPRYSAVNHALREFHQRAYNQTEGWFHDASRGGWCGWDTVLPKPATGLGKSYDQAIQKYLTSVKSDKPLYSIGTWDSDREYFSPHPYMTTPWLNVDIHGLRRHLKELKSKGYSCHRVRHNDSTVDSDPSVLVERTDGSSEASVRNCWLGGRRRR